MQLISISAVLLLTATTVERAGLTALSGKTWRQREDLQPQQWWRCSLRSLMSLIGFSHSMCAVWTVYPSLHGVKYHGCRSIDQSDVSGIF